MKTIEPHPKDAQTFIIRPAGATYRFALVRVSRVSCAHIQDGIAFDLSTVQEPNLYQMRPGGVISFEDLEAIYFAAKEARREPLQQATRQRWEKCLGQPQAPPQPLPIVNVYPRCTKTFRRDLLEMYRVLLELSWEQIKETKDPDLFKKIFTQFDRLTQTVKALEKIEEELCSTQNR